MEYSYETRKKEDEESGFRTRFGSADGGESVPDVGRVVDSQSGGLNDDDGRRDLHRQAPIIHETQEIDQRESDAREDPKDGHQVRDEDQRHADNGRHRQAQIADQFATNHLQQQQHGHDSFHFHHLIFFVVCYMNSLDWLPIRCNCG